MLCAAAHGPGQSADAVAGLEDAEVVAQFGELVPDDETGYAGTEDEHLGAARPSGECWTNAGLPGHQIQRRHRGHDERGTADDAELFEEPASGQDRKRTSLCRHSPAAKDYTDVTSGGAL